MKYQCGLFLFFFMSLECCGVEKEIKEDSRTTACTSNHKVQELCQQVDLTVDLRLDPAKGETLWSEGEVAMIIPSYEKPFDVPGDLEITLSPLARSQDCWIIYHGLECFCAEKIGNRPHEKILGHPFSQDCIVLMYQESVFLRLDSLLIEFGLQATLSYLARIESSAIDNGAKRAYVYAPKDSVLLDTSKSSTIPYESTQLSLALLDRGYQMTGEFQELRFASQRRQYFKQFVKPSEATPSSGDFSWVVKTDDVSQSFRDKFAIFVRKKGRIVGGLFGRLTLNVATPHSFIDFFWIDQKFKGKGIGTKVLDYAINYSKENGAQMVELETAQYQAPGFYEKNGFVKIKITSKCIQSLDGKLNDFYLYRKTI